MFCTKCGAEIADGSKFCTSCGAKIDADNVVDEVEVVNNGKGRRNGYKDDRNQVVPFVNDVETIRNDNFAGGQTQIIFDKKHPIDRQKMGSKAPIAIIVVAMILVIGLAGAAVYVINDMSKKKIEAISKTGIETIENGRVVYNKGNNNYAKNELIDEGSSTYYFNSNGDMVKNDWIEYKGKWYYCENDGKVAKSKWVQSTYYVNEHGEMLKNTTTPDGYLVGADGKYVDQAAILAAQRAAQASSGGGNTGSNYNNNNTYNQTQIQTQTTQAKSGSKQVTNIDYSKEVYIVAYEKYQSYVYYDDETSVDIVVEYPIFGGQNQAEVDSMNNSMQYCITNELENYIESDINNKSDDNKVPRRVNINEATIASIEQNKIYVIFKGNLERKNASSAKLNYRFIYERESGSGYVRD